MTDEAFAFVTEMPNNRVTLEQIQMIACRYSWAADVASDMDVLEVASGPGLGLGYMATKCRSLVAGDYDPHCLKASATHYRGRIPLVRLDAQALPIGCHTYDVILLFEAVYYLQDVDQFLCECSRVLRANGTILLTLPNKDWPGFAPSPRSHRYFSPPELQQLFRRHGFDICISGAFPRERVGISRRILKLVRRASTVLGLVPRNHKRTEAIRRVLKQLLYRDLVPVPHEIELDITSPCEFDPLPLDGPNQLYRVFYVSAVLQDTNDDSPHRKRRHKHSSIP